MKPRSNSLKEKLKSGQPVIGVVCPGYWPELVEICGYLGYDWVQIDLEHGPMSMRQAAELVRAAEAAGITPVGRVPYNAPHHIMRFLDAGMQGVVVPHISTKADAEAAVRAIYYHPYGERGLGGTRASGFGALYSIQEFVSYTNNQILFVAILEDREGVENLDEILTVPQVDVVAIGHTDLSNSLGVPGDISSPVVQEAMKTAIAKIKKSHVVLGLGVTDGNTARKRIQEQGAGWVIVQLSQLLINGARDFLKVALQDNRSAQ
jgi:4-hydroxy-2-oxoheptanedioate aldolase